VLEASEANLAHARLANARADEELNAAKQSKKERERAAAAAERAEGAAGATAASAATVSGSKRKVNPARETEEEAAAAPPGAPAAAAEAPKPSIKFSMLPALKKQLVDDWDRVTQKKMLVRLPRPAGLHTAASALDAYVVHLHASAAADGAAGGGGAGEAAQYATPETVAAALRSCSSAAMPFGFKAARDAIEGLRLYFDRALPLYLLYRFERLQLDALHKYAQLQQQGKGAGAGAGAAAAASSSAAAAAAVAAAAAAVYGPEHLLRLFVKLPELLAHIALNEEETKVLQATVNDLLKCVRGALRGAARARAPPPPLSSSRRCHPFAPPSPLCPQVSRQAQRHFLPQRRHAELQKGARRLPEAVGERRGRRTRRRGRRRRARVQVGAVGHHRPPKAARPRMRALFFPAAAPSPRFLEERRNERDSQTTKEGEDTPRA